MIDKTEATIREGERTARNAQGWMTVGTKKLGEKGQATHSGSHTPKHFKAGCGPDFRSYGTEPVPHVVGHWEMVNRG